MDKALSSIKSSLPLMSNLEIVKMLISFGLEKFAGNYQNISTREWLNSLSKNADLAYLNSSTEDIYTLKNGKKVKL